MHRAVLLVPFLVPGFGCGPGGDEPSTEVERPEVVAVTILPDPATTDDDLSCAATADREGVRFTWAWEVDGEAAGEGQALDATLHARGRSVRCTATPHLDGHAGEPASAVIDIANAPPVVTSVALDPPQPTREGPIACEATATDADGDPVTLSYDWTVEEAPAGEGSHLLPTSWFERGQGVSCTVTPFDGEEEGEPASVEVVVANAPPAVQLHIEPQPAFTDTPLTCHAEVDDADGDPLTTGLAWRVDGLLRGTNATLPDARFERGQVAQCTVTAHDGITSVEQSAEVTISNAPPTAPQVAVTPSDPVELMDDLQCVVEVDATDADGDALTYLFEWTIDGAPFDEAITTEHEGDTVPGDLTQGGEMWSCTVTPWDGLDHGAAGDDAVEIEALPEERVYFVDDGDLHFEMGQFCSANHAYSCERTPYGFTWNDLDLRSPREITLEYNHGINCNEQAEVGPERQGRINDTVIDDDFMTGPDDQCTCTDPQPTVMTYTVDPPEDYVSGGSNLFTLTAHECEGFSRNPDWDDHFARITVRY